MQSNGLKLKSDRVYIKSNYIKKAKEEWVYCKADLVLSDETSMLRLCTINGNNSLDLSRKPSADSCDLNESVQTTIPTPHNLPNLNLKILCNLSEFKSAEVKPVNFKNMEKFSVKLIPSRILHSKRLFIVPECDDDLTKWCSMLTDCIAQNRKPNKHPLKNRNFQEELSIMLNKNIVENSVKRKSFGSNEALETPQKIPRNSRENNNSNLSLNEKSDDVYFALDENDIYDGNSLESFHTVQIEDSSDARKLGLKGTYILRLKKESMEMGNYKTGETLHEFPYIYIRRFGAKIDVLRIEAGRRCSTGEGYFMFRFRDAAKVAESIRDLTRELKKSYDDQSLMSQSTINGHTLNGKLPNPNGSFLRDSVIREEEDLDSLYQKPNRKTSVASINIIANGTLTKAEANRFYSVQDVNVDRDAEDTASLASTVLPSSAAPLVSARPPLHPNTSVNTRSILSPVSPPVKPIIKTVNSQPLRSTTLSKPVLINTGFNRNNYSTASFSYRKPHAKQSIVSLPITKDDSTCNLSYQGTVVSPTPTLMRSDTSGIYDNVCNPTQHPHEQSFKSTNGNSTSNGGGVYRSSYTMPAPIPLAPSNGIYDNVGGGINSSTQQQQSHQPPNNLHNNAPPQFLHQRNMKDLEAMLHKLGIPTTNH